MSALVRMQNAQLAFGHAPLLDHAELVIESGERLCIVGRNGAGKSTLLKVIYKEVQLDDGQLHWENDTRVAMLPQDPPARSDKTVFTYVAESFTDAYTLLEQYEELSQRLINESDNAKLLEQLSRVQEKLDAVGGWELQQRIESTLTQLQLDPHTQLSALSGGWLRRVAMARAFVTDPDVLLLDEPTNHLDIETVQWLEKVIKNFKGAIVFISHDRAFIRSLATRIIDVDRGVLRSYPGSYDTYLATKEHELEVEEAQNAEFDKKLAQEEAWVRQGIKARRTRNEGRVRALKKLRQERAERRSKQGQVAFSAGSSEKSGKIVWKCEHLGYQIEDKRLINDLTLNIQRGDKIALVGPNGIGKSTLLQLILGNIKPTEGKCEQGTKIKVAYYDQHRAALDPEMSVADNVSEGKQEVVHQGRTRHIYSYLQDFLFTPLQARAPLKSFSGGERNRVLLAKILLSDSNLLILDEPTNDLDVETLELLESLVVSYDGTVLVVSHDREFIDNTVSTVVLFEGDGVLTEIVGGFHEVRQYLEHKSKNNKNTEKETPAKGTNTDNTKSDKTDTLAQPRKKLSYKLQRELEQLPGIIEQLETELSQRHEQVSKPNFFNQEPSETQPILDSITEIEKKLDEAIERWDELEQLQG
ncbi:MULTISPECIES: ATP-binding cassette domain-containing protein [Gammaproteobacteria]|uniref:ATP-binding cassette ATPase Uup n=1 Tax=Gammaproteobacteria TaxID=1236 RepID=UPI000DCF6542|nr:MULTISPECIES: ATP-binding cassette domain-containing protein [Gammaproteobacteria]RTE87221.1 ATP-binding cassette domain-containing protein [Aliidiomarina sp. B3213]TCZ92991.1 ATP-binding cassette domain-containing protein [Lysobacter sp. N42]